MLSRSITKAVVFFLLICGDFGSFAADVFECSCSCKRGTCTRTCSSCSYQGGDVCDWCSTQCSICQDQTTLYQLRSLLTCPPCPSTSSTDTINCTGSTSKTYATHTECPPCGTPNESTVYTGSTAEVLTTVCPPCPCPFSAGKYTCSTTERFTKDPVTVPSSAELTSSCGFSAGVVVCAVFGGVFLGSIITSSVFIYFCQRERREQEKKTNVFHNCNQNPAYENGDYDQMNTRSKSQNPTKVSNVNPFPREHNISTPNATEDGVYNHLNEAATATTITDDVYDHARPHSLTSFHCEGYGTLVFDHEGNDVYMKGDIDKEAECSVGMDTKNEHTAHNYFVLEKETI